jgi:hypothetical protein
MRNVGSYLDSHIDVAERIGVRRRLRSLQFLPYGLRF